MFSEIFELKNFHENLHLQMPLKLVWYFLPLLFSASCESTLLFSILTFCHQSSHSWQAPANDRFLLLLEET